jgi:galactokinase
MLLAAEYADRFGDQPLLTVRAPGRVDLMGSHTDYNEGYVLTLSIDRDTWIAAGPRRDGVVQVQSLDLEGSSSFSLDRVTYDRAAPWSNYVRGVASVLGEEGYPLRGWNGLISSTVPIGSGLSSSAALEVATALVFRELGGWTIDPLELALLCQRAENEFVGMNCGILDQYSSIMGRPGRAMLLDCRALDSEAVRVPEDICIAICDTRAKRELTGSEYPERRAQCEEGVRRLAAFYPDIRALRDVSIEEFGAHEVDLPETVARRCRFVLEENARVLRLAQALPRGDRVAIGTLTESSYAGARDLYEIGSGEMEAMVTAMLAAPGVIGARQAGAGFGGCMVALVDAVHIDAFSRQVERAYQDLTGIKPAVYPTVAAEGAGIVSRSG